VNVRADNIPENRAMSVEKKILLVEDIWNSIVAEESDIPIPKSHIDELERRREKLNPGSLLTLEELQMGIDRRK